ncbi:MAG TPA: hypothetical protein VF032_09185 [Thermoleophilaceae bacterium]
MSGLDAAARVHDPRARVDRMNAICTSLSVPSTALLAAIQKDCQGTVGVYDLLTGLTGRLQGCDQQGAGGRPCVVDALSRLHRVAANEVTTSRASVHELRRRGLRGLCARVIGANPQQIAALASIRNAAGYAASAASSADAPDYLADLRRLGAGVRALARNSYPGSQRRAILTCPHA